MIGTNGIRSNGRRQANVAVRVIYVPFPLIRPLPLASGYLLLHLAVILPALLNGLPRHTRLTVFFPPYPPPVFDTQLKVG